MFFKKRANHIFPSHDTDVFRPLCVIIITLLVELIFLNFLSGTTIANVVIILLHNTMFHSYFLILFVVLFERGTTTPNFLLCQEALAKGHWVKSYTFGLSHWIWDDSNCNIDLWVNRLQGKTIIFVGDKAMDGIFLQFTDILAHHSISASVATSQEETLREVDLLVKLDGYELNSPVDNKNQVTILVHVAPSGEEGVKEADKEKLALYNRKSDDGSHWWSSRGGTIDFSSLLPHTQGREGDTAVFTAEMCKIMASMIIHAFCDSLQQIKSNGLEGPALQRQGVGVYEDEAVAGRRLRASEGGVGPAAAGGGIGRRTADTMDANVITARLVRARTQSLAVLMSSLAVNDSTSAPTLVPTWVPTSPTPPPSMKPSSLPSVYTSPIPSTRPSYKPFPNPTAVPTRPPSLSPTSPTGAPSPTATPTSLPTGPSMPPSSSPSPEPSPQPSFAPTPSPSPRPSWRPTTRPTSQPTPLPTRAPTRGPTLGPTYGSDMPTPEPTHNIPVQFMASQVIL